MSWSVELYIRSRVYGNWMFIVRFVAEFAGESHEREDWGIFDTRGFLVGRGGRVRIAWG